MTTQSGNVGRVEQRRDGWKRPAEAGNLLYQEQNFGKGTSERELEERGYEKPEGRRNLGRRQRSKTGGPRSQLNYPSEGRGSEERARAT